MIVLLIISWLYREIDMFFGIVFGPVFTAGQEELFFELLDETVARITDLIMITLEQAARLYCGFKGHDFAWRGIAKKKYTVECRVCGLIKEEG